MSVSPLLNAAPRIGSGTWQLKGDACYESVRTALRTGYRHIDTARMYGNEEQVGRAIADAEVSRDDLFVATKLWHDELSPADVEEHALESRDRLQVETIDLLYVHWPVGTYDAAATLPALEQLRADGIVEHVGLSNFTPPLLSEAVRIMEKPPLALQLEMHPFLQQRELHKMALEHDMYLVAYSPLKRADGLNDPVLEEIADEMNATPAQVCLAWHLSKNSVCPIPKSSDPEHIRQNFEARDLQLSDAQLQRINDLDAGDRAIDPSFAPW